MSTLRHDALDSPGPDAVVSWRIGRLREAGFDFALAVVLAEDCSYDLHALLSLVERGCPPPLAARILAPLDDHLRRC
jgi:hypothetical protein